MARVDSIAMDHGFMEFAMEGHEGFGAGQADVFSPGQEFMDDVGAEPSAWEEVSEPLTESMATINAILERIEGQHHQIEAMARRVREFYTTPTEQVYQGLLETLKSMADTVEEEQGALFGVLQEHVLTPKELFAAKYLRPILHAQHVQLDIYAAEVKHIRSKHDAPRMMALVVMKQPFPYVLRQKKRIEHDDLVVKLLVGATVDIHQLSPVSCHVHGLEDTTAADKKMLESNVQAMCPETMEARFPLHFVEGTRKVPGYMKFSVRAEFTQLGDQTITCNIESDPSNSFVVMTNQKQWEDCERHLFRMDAFGDQTAVNWARFANVMQTHFLLATKQDAENPQRPLSSYDFAYIHTQFFGGRQRIEAKEFDGFWDWFGKTLQMLRYQRHVGHMFLHGFVYGYMSREDVLAALNRQPAGTFVIRFSERHQGQFAVAYIHKNDNAVHHYLVKPTDTAGAKITLADFLRNIPLLTHIQKFEPQSAAIFSRVQKDQVLETYYVKSIPGDPSGSGYDHLIS